MKDQIEALTNERLRLIEERIKAISELDLNIATHIPVGKKDTAKKIANLLGRRESLQRRIKALGRLISEHQEKISALKGPKKHDFCERFVDVARVLLDRDTFDKIVSRAKEMVEEDESRRG